MIETVFIAALGLGLAALYRWAFARLPREGYQILAAVPRLRDREGCFRGSNLTWYGLFSATACMLAATLFLVLLGAQGVDFSSSALLAALLLGTGYLAAAWIARWVERRPNGFTVGGASFTVLLAAPAWLLLVERLGGTPLPRAGTFAALAIAYVLGEGVGRLACISFGCCYGKPVAALPPALRPLFRRIAFSFEGGTKKIAYGSGLQGVEVVPIQALTAVALGVLALAGMLFLLAGRPRVAALAAFLGSQVWRILSETLRADDRGRARTVSAYQVLSLAAIPIALALGVLVGADATVPLDLAAGFLLLWHPAPILLLQALWIAVFLHTGVSKVTAAQLFFHVVRDRA